MSDVSWHSWRDRLAAELATLEESEFVIFDHEVPAEMQRRSKPRKVLFVQTKSKTLPSGFLVQFVGQGQGVVMADLAGPASLGGHIELTDAQDEQIRALGWRGPGDPGHWENYAPDYTVVDWPCTQAAALARIACDALAIQGASPGLAWRIHRDR